MKARLTRALVAGTIALLDDVSGGEASFDIVPLTATSDGQTTFEVTGGYTLGGIIVILGGATLAPTHYTATDGANVVLASGDGVVVGSELVVLGRFSAPVRSTARRATNSVRPS